MRTLRKRPGSRLSLGDDLWSRHQSSDFTDDTSLEPNGANPWGELTEEGRELDKEPLEYLGTRLARYQAYLPAPEAADSVIEKAQLESAVAMMGLEVKRLQRERAQGTHAQLTPVFEPEAFSAHAIRLAKSVLERWKTQNSLRLAEQVCRAF